MSSRPAVHVLFLAVSFTLACRAAAIDISEYMGSSGRKSLEITTSDVVRIETPRHGIAVVQFIDLGLKAAHYRWRYRAPSSTQISAGTGRVRESYDSKELPDGSHLVTPRPDHDTKVKAGQIILEWSAGGKSRGWVYYLPSRASVQKLSSDAFDGDL